MAKLKSVLFLGLGATHSGWPQLKGFTGEVWTLNDWYALKGPYRDCRRPNRVYNIHADFIEKEKEILERGRFRGWREAYDRCGAQIVTQCDLGLKNQRPFDLATAEKWFPDPLFWCGTWSYMFADAIMEGYHEIRMERVSLFSTDEYMKQAYGTLLGINTARKAGVTVVWPWEKTVKEDLAQLTIAELGAERDVNFRYGTDKACTVKIDTSKLPMPVLPDAAGVALWL